MSRFGDKSGNDAPTRLVRNDPTKKVGFGSEGDGVTQKIDETQKISGDRPTEKFSADEASLNASASAAVTAEEDDRFQRLSKPANPKTVVFRPTAGEEATAAADLPVVAWVVVLEGAGKGKAIELSYGMQKIGRDPSQDVVLDFGDESISREFHASVEYDPKTRNFYLSKGENLVYLNGDRVGQGAEASLSQGDIIELGNTKLKFMPFCGPDFCWQVDS